MQHNPGVGLGLYLYAVRLTEADRVGRRKLRPHEVHFVSADISGAPDEDVLVSQPHASRPWGGMARIGTMLEHLLTYFASKSGRRQSGEYPPRT